VTSRRSFLVTIAALGAVTAARAQPASPLRIGWISYTAPGVAIDAFQDGMRALGHTGSNAVGIEVRVVEPDPERVRAAIEELQRLPVALIDCSTFPLRNPAEKDPSRKSFCPPATDARSRSPARPGSCIRSLR